MTSSATQAFAEATTDYERLLDTIARNLSEVVADGCAVFLLDGPGTCLHAVAIQAREANALEQMRETYSRAPLVLDEQPAMRKILETGEALLVPRLDPAAARTDTTPEQVAAQRKLGLHSFLVVALRSHERALGILALGRFLPGSPPFDDQDRELAQMLADHASLAIQNARLYAAAQAARRDAERAEEALRKSETTHRFFFESSPMATFVFDTETLEILAANDAALGLYGYSKTELLALRLDDLRAPDDQARLAERMRAAGDGDMVGSARHRRKDGTIVHVQGQNHPTVFDGRPARLVVLQDHTERLRAEAARLESEGRLQRTLDSMMEGYTILGHDFRYLYVNEVGARHARLTKEQLLGRTPMELYPEFEKTGMYALLQRCLAARAPVQEEEALTLADGSTAYFEVNVQPTREGLVILSIDTTERRRVADARESLEEQLRQSQRMDAVGRLAGGVAHDFNNLLSIILGYGEGVLSDLKPDDPLRADVEEMQKAAQRAAELTKQLLLFSRQQVPEPRVLDLNEVLAAMEKMLRRLLGEHLELVTTLQPGLGKIRADRSNIEQVIMNLLVNARDAMPAGGKLTIETANVVLDEAFVSAHLGTKPGPYVLFAVTDTGVGMEKATRLRIFEPFFSTKEPGKGTGLGLSTVFGIVQQSGGGVWVYSEPGRGSSFKVYFPRTEGARDVPRPSLPPQRKGGSETILLVEDDEAVRNVAERILLRNGYRVISAGSAGDALLILQEQARSIDLLLTDVVMPRMSGPELAQRIAAQRPDLRILYMSGYTDRSVVAQGALESGVSFLQKPFTAELLARRVRSVLDGESGV